jgi:lipoprotein-releasing system permease protein
MYKLLLCWRYLRTRWIALASIISVMLGVATMIVVNSVMEGFSREMEDRIHGVLSDLSFQARDFNGAPDAEWHMQQIQALLGDKIEGMTAVVVVPGMLNFRVGQNYVTQQVEIIGIDERTHATVSDYGRYLQHPENRKGFNWKLHERGYDVQDHQAGSDAPERRQMEIAGWVHRGRMAEMRAFEEQFYRRQQERARQEHQTIGGETADESGGAEVASSVPTSDPFAASADPLSPAQGKVFDPAKEQHTGVVLGIAMASYRSREGDDRFVMLPGDDVKLTFPTVGVPPKVVSDEFTIVDLYESKMSEYDSKFVFVPIRKLQELRGMIDPTSGIGMFNSIQIRLKPGESGDEARDLLASKFPEELFVVSTWRDKQGPLLAAVEMETAILNVLLFLIIAVAGFGILAIFYMIVVEKTRDIGILKSLGAHGRGVMGIFLSYGLLLGAVGAGTGMLLGLVFVHYINEIAEVLGWVTGRKVFDPSIYYFYSIPAIVQASTVAWIVAGALVIAVAASVAPAVRAARLHPVEALRYE